MLARAGLLHLPAPQPGRPAGPGRLVGKHRESGDLGIRAPQLATATHAAPLHPAVSHAVPTSSPPLPHRGPRAHPRGAVPSRGCAPGGGAGAPRSGIRGDCGFREG
jgi:hypothetical protein